MFIVYKITQQDGKSYIGTTSEKRFRQRMSSHKRSKRFVEPYTIDVIYMTDDHNHCLDCEEALIKEFDTFYNGLNRSVNGRGNHNSKNFTTLGMKFSDETKRKIGLAGIGQQRTLGMKHKDETKLAWSQLRKGRVWGKTKLTKEQIISIRKLYESRPEIESAGKVSKNGRILSYESAFSKKYHTNYGITPQMMYRIVTNKAWNETLQQH